MGSSKSSTSDPTQTPLAKKQLNILRDREAFFQQFGQPALEKFFEQAQDFELDDSFQVTTEADFLRTPAQQVGEQFNIQQEQLQRSFAQRGLEGSGIAAQGQSQLEAGRQNALRQASLQAQLGAAESNNQQQLFRNQNALSELGVQGSALGQLLGFAPQPTQAAPVATKVSGGGGGLGATIGGAVGGIAGSFFGPAGTVIGSGIGSGIGGAV